MINEGQKKLRHRIFAVEKITEMFLEDLYSDREPFWNRESFGHLTEDEKLSISGIRAQERHEKIIEIIGDYGLDGIGVMRLFNAIEYKAIGEINKLLALVQTTEPDQLRKYGVPNVLIENAKTIQGLRTSTRAKGAAGARWEDDPKSYAACKAFEIWKAHDKKGRYKAGLARNMINEVDGIKGILVDGKGLAEKFSKWERGEELPEC